MFNGTNQPAARELAEKLAAARHHNYWMARCPAHADDKASLAIKEAGDGRVLVYCHAGCSQDAVIDALRDRGLWPDRPKTNGDTKPRAEIVHLRLCRHRWHVGVPGGALRPERFPAAAT